MSTNYRQYIANIIPPINVIINNGQAQTDIIPLYGVTIKAIEIANQFDGTALTFDVSFDTSPSPIVRPYKNANNEEVSIDCDANGVYGLPVQDFYGIQAIRIKSNATQTAGDVSLWLYVRGI